MRALMLLTVAVTVVGCGGCGLEPKQCRSLAGTGGPICVPDAGVAPAGQQLTLQIVAPGSAGCTTVASDCVVTVDGGTVHLELTGTACDPVTPRACTDEERFDPKPCTVPALAEGDYAVTSPGQRALRLQVRDAGVTSCTATPF